MEPRDTMTIVGDSHLGTLAVYVPLRWLEGMSFEELAGELGLSKPRDAEMVVRAALARLRRQFGDRADG